MLRTLGYPRLVSLDNFRQPNFPLVAEILIWLMKKFESTASIPTDIEAGACVLRDAYVPLPTAQCLA